jgi:hypothetical protein
VRSIERQLQSRPQIGTQDWPGDDGRREFARWLSDAIAKEISWCNDRFIEADPMEILLWAHEDGLDVDFLIRDLEHRIGQRLRPDQIEHLATLNLGAAVDYLLALDTKAQARPVPGARI